MKVYNNQPKPTKKFSARKPISPRQAAKLQARAEAKATANSAEASA